MRRVRLDDDDLHGSNRLADLADRIREAWDRARASSVEFAEQVLEAGRLLNEAKDECSHGEWLPFLERAGVHERQARRLMQLARSGLKSDTVSDLGIKAALSYLAQDNKAEQRDERERELGANIAALPDQLYGVILADPEWRFEPWSRETGLDRAADNHYPTSELEAIKARDVPSIAAEDCVLFLWATAPMLPQALEVMDAWGFAYRSHLIWDKLRIGTGYWARNRHELLLIGVKGEVPAPAPGTQPESVIMAKPGRHSEKPEVFLELIEQLFPSLPKIELNRRGEARPGWDAWGFEADLDLS